MGRRALCTFCMHRLHRVLGITTVPERAYSADVPSRPKYNYGLPGKGKTKTKEKMWKRQQTDSTTYSIQSQGEVLFGIHPVLLALESNRRRHLYSVYLEDKHQEGKLQETFSRITILAEEQNVDVQYVSKKTLTYLSGNRPHQGVCLDASRLILPDLDPQKMLEERFLDEVKKPLWLMLYNVQDPMNFGAILRTSFFLGVDHVIVPELNSCAPSPVVSKASSGALEVMDLYRLPGSYHSIMQLAKAWQSTGGVVVGTASDTDTSRTTHRLQDFSLTVPVLLIVGNEGSGVDSDVLDLCNILLTITPCLGAAPRLGVGSLNVSVATGILIHWLQMSRENPQ